jgi:plastin-1
MSITKTSTSLSKSGQGRPMSDTEMLKWADGSKGQAVLAAHSLVQGPIDHHGHLLP